jgi:hypothetical protein
MHVRSVLLLQGFGLVVTSSSEWSVLMFIQISRPGFSEIHPSNLLKARPR